MLYMLYKKIKKNTCRYYYHNLDDIIYMIYSSWHIAQNILKLVILGHLLPLHPHKNSIIKILKNEKILLEISLFYTCVPKIAIIWCTVPEWDRQNFLSFWAFFLPFQPPDNRENQNFKIEKNIWRCYHFAHLHHKWQSYDVWFLRYGA